MEKGLRERLVNELNELKADLNYLMASEAEFKQSYAAVEEELTRTSMLYRTVKRFIPFNIGTVGFNISTIFTVDPVFGGVMTGVSVASLIINIAILRKCKKQMNDASGILFLKDFEKKSRNAMKKSLTSDIDALTEEVYGK